MSIVRVLQHVLDPAKGEFPRNHAIRCLWKTKAAVLSALSSNGTPRMIIEDARSISPAMISAAAQTDTIQWMESKTKPADSEIRNHYYTRCNVRMKIRCEALKTYFERIKPMLAWPPVT
jgi:hypothetical protein